MTRILLVVLAIASSIEAQLPPSLRDKLKHDIPSTRKDAVKELGAMGPSAKVSATMLASALAAALKDKDQDVREAAAGLLGAGRPADIAVPALLKALAAVEDDFESTRRQLAAAAALGKPHPTLGGVHVRGLDAYAGTILDALQDHWDERTASGAAQVVKGWNLARMSGNTTERACTLLCRWKTRPALDTVVDVLVRAQALPPPARVKNDQAVLIETLGKQHTGAIILALDVAVTASGAEKPVGFNEKNPGDWKALLIANAPKFPWKLAESRPTSKPAASRPAGEK